MGLAELLDEADEDLNVAVGHVDADVADRAADLLHSVPAQYAWTDPLTPCMRFRYDAVALKSSSCTRQMNLVARCLF